MPGRHRKPHFPAGPRVPRCRAWLGTSQGSGLPGSYYPGYYPGSYPGSLPPELASWDVTAVTQADLVAVHAYLARRTQYDLVGAPRLAEDLASRLYPRVAGLTVPMDPERFLEAVALVKSARG